jgi:hypothetical protein
MAEFAKNLASEYLSHILVTHTRQADSGVLSHSFSFTAIDSLMYAILDEKFPNTHGFYR